MKGYTVDWSAIMPQGEYNLTFSFMAGHNDAGTGVTDFPLVFATFIPSSIKYQVQTEVTAYSSCVLGLLKPSYKVWIEGQGIWTLPVVFLNPSIVNIPLCPKSLIKPIKF